MNTKDDKFHLTLDAHKAKTNTFLIKRKNPEKNFFNKEGKKANEAEALTYAKIDSLYEEDLLCTHKHIPK